MELSERDYLRIAGIVVRRLRQERGLTQQRLADQAALSRSYISRLERGIAQMRVSQLWALADAFGVGADDLWREFDREEERWLADPEAFGLS